MKLRARHVLVPALGCLLAVALPAPAAAAAAKQPAVTLSASPTPITFGSATTLSGHITPWGQGETVRIVNGDGKVLASAKTKTQGKFSVPFAPRNTVWVHAEWNDVRSAPVKVAMRPRISATLSDVLLFGTATARGQVLPVNRSVRVKVELLRGWTSVITRRVAMGGTGHFVAHFPIAQPGTYRVRVTYGDPDHLTASALSASHATPLPSLGIGSSGPAVKLLEQRLVALHYHLIGVDTRYDFRTADAVMAFRKVQGMARVGSVDTATWYRLASPRLFGVRDHSSGRHVEVNQTLQVLAVVVNGKVDAMIHVSTGKPSTPTHDGHFTVYRKLAGYSINRLYYPSYFDGHRAIHGWTEVPSYAASHGCVRIPYWVTLWMFDQDPIGTRVLVYH